MRCYNILLFVAPYLLPFVSGEEETHGEEGSKEMGPVAFMWPPDREWGAAQDNTAPCGSSQGIENRTDFPLMKGAVALITQDDSWNVQLAISYEESPKTNDDFEIVIKKQQIKSLEPGHECYPLPTPPRDVEEGTNATLQLKYLSEFDSDDTETFYACADITYIATSKFDTQVPCFNVTSDEFISPNPEPTSGSDSDSDSDSDSESDSDSKSKPSNSGSSGLSDGAIAGIVVGVVGGMGLIVASIFGYRRYQQQKRIRLHELSVRNVKWDSAGKPLPE